MSRDDSVAAKYIRRLQGARSASRRAAAASALMAFTDEESETALFGALGDPSMKVRTTVVIALVQREPTRPMEPIVQALRRRLVGSAPEPYELPSAQELFDLELEWCDALPLVDILETAFPSGPEPLRYRATRVLARVGSADAQRVLATARSDDSPRVRALAEQASR